MGYLSWQYGDALSSRHNVFISGGAGARGAVGHPEWDDESVTWGANPLVDEPDAIIISSIARVRPFNHPEVIFQTCVLLAKRGSKSDS